MLFEDAKRAILKLTRLAGDDSDRVVGAERRNLRPTTTPDPFDLFRSAALEPLNCTSWPATNCTVGSALLDERGTTPSKYSVSLSFNTRRVVAVPASGITLSMLGTQDPVEHLGHLRFRRPILGPATQGHCFDGKEGQTDVGRDFNQFAGACAGTRR